MATSSYKLMYFDGRGRGELSRMIFAEAGVKYEDKRVGFSDWPTVKPTTPYGQMPVLYVDDKPLPQSGAIARYLARTFKLEGGEGIQAAYADMAVETIGDLGSKLPLMEKDAKKKAEILKEQFERITPILEKMEARFTSYGEDRVYLIANTISYADLALFILFENLARLDKKFITKFPKLQKLFKRVSDRPNIKKWIQSRPETPF